MIKIENGSIFSTENKNIRKIGTKDVFKKRVVTDDADINDYEELDYEIDTDLICTETERRTKIRELIRLRYDEEEEFCLHRKFINLLRNPTISANDNTINPIISEYNDYNTYVEECIAKAENEVIKEKAKAKAKRLNNLNNVI